MPKKTKIVQNKSQPPAEAGGPSSGVKAAKGQRASRTTVARKTRGTSAGKGGDGKRAKISMPDEAGGGLAEPSDEAIRVRAYFISERRRRFALPGDAESDWLEAKRQLLSETGPR